MALRLFYLPTRPIVWRSSGFLKGLIGAVVGTAVALLTWHLYTDHVALHTMLTFLNTHAQKIAAP